MARGKLEPGMKQRKKGESGNPKGQPRKGISLVNKQLEEKGYKPASKQDIEVNYMQMLQLEEKELKFMVEDKDKPMLIRIIAKNMLSGKGFEIIEKMLDRGIGKAVQKSEVTGSDGGVIGITVHSMTFDSLESNTGHISIETTEKS